MSMYFTCVIMCGIMENMANIDILCMLVVFFYWNPHSIGTNNKLLEYSVSVD